MKRYLVPEYLSEEAFHFWTNAFMGCAFFIVFLAAIVALDGLVEVIGDYYRGRWGR